MPGVPVFVLRRIQHFRYRTLGIAPVAVHPVGVGEIENPLQGDLHAFYPESGHSARMRRFVKSLVAVREDSAVGLCQNRLSCNRLPDLLFLSRLQQQAGMGAWLWICKNCGRNQNQRRDQDPEFHFSLMRISASRK